MPHDINIRSLIDQLAERQRHDSGLSFISLFDSLQFTAVIFDIGAFLHHRLIAPSSQRKIQCRSGILVCLSGVFPDAPTPILREAGISPPVSIARISSRIGNLFLPRYFPECENQRSEHISLFPFSESPPDILSPRDGFHFDFRSDTGLLSSGADEMISS